MSTQMYLNNGPPVYAEGASIARNIDENPSSVGLAVGVPILATDTDAGAAGILVYELLTSGNTNKGWWGQGCWGWRGRSKKQDKFYNTY